MNRFFSLFLLPAILFSSCTNLQVETSVNPPTSTFFPNAPVQTFTPDSLKAQATKKVETVISSQTSEATPVPASTIITSTPTSLRDYDNEITWHPQYVLLEISEHANDGNPWFSKWPLIRIYWDGTIIQGAGDEVKVTKLSRLRMCKLLNSISQAGWFNVDNFAYDPLFSGTWSETISIYTWHEKIGGGYLFTYALQGEGARDSLFCGDCIITSHHNFISDAEANTYYLIYNNLPTDFELKTHFDEPKTVPNDYQITCKESDGVYPFVKVEQETKYVIFSGSGRRAVGVLNQNSTKVLSAVYKIDGSKYYFSYDPKSFGAEILTVIPRLWAKDNQYVYLTLYPDNRDFQPFHEAIALQQIDTNTGQSRYLFQGQQNNLYSYELSNTGSRLAYIKQNQTPLELVILDLSTDTEHKITIESPNISADRYTIAGGLEFNFSINKLLFSGIYDDNGSLKTTFFMVDLLNPSKLYVIDERTGAYKIKYMNYESDSPRWMKICPFNEGITGDDYCNGENVDLP